MKLYKVTYLIHSESSQGFSFHTSKAAANKKLNENKRLSGSDYIETDIEVIEFKPTLKMVCDLLNRHASHPDNG